MIKPIYNQLYTPLSNKKNSKTSKKKAKKSFFKRLNISFSKFKTSFLAKLRKINFSHQTEPVFTTNSNKAFKSRLNLGTPALIKYFTFALFIILGLLLVYYETNSKTFAVKNYDVEFEKLDQIEVPVLASSQVEEFEFTNQTDKQGQVLGTLDVSEADKLYEQKLVRIKAEEERLRKEAEERRKFELKIQGLNSFFAKYNSPLNGHAETILESAKKCGFDHREVLAIAMKESGLGRAMIPDMKGTAFGFIDGIRGETWETALPRVTCAVASKYVNKYGLTTNLARAYGPKSWTDAEAQVWINHVIGYKNMIP